MIEKNLEPVSGDGGKIHVDADAAWTRLRGRLESEGLIPDQARPVRRLMHPAFRIAATIAIIVALGAGGWLIFSDTGEGMKLVADTGREEMFGITLPDGSVVDLNAHSRIHFNEDDQGNRLVKLAGEAYFNVTPDPGHPFIIRSGGAMVRVTGTAFTVRTVPHKGRVEVYVESGSVQLYRSGDTGHVINLGEGNMGVLENSILSREDNTDENYLSWKTRKLTFRQTELGSVAEVLNRTYKKEILFENDALEDCRFTGTFDTQPVDSVIKVIQIAFNLEVEYDRETYRFSGEGCY